MSRFCAKKPADLETSLCIELRTDGGSYVPCPINHHIIMARSLYDFFWEVSQLTTCQWYGSGCGGDHNPMMCPKIRCHVCLNLGHWNLVCPEASQHVSYLNKDGYSCSLITDYVQDLSKLKTVRLRCAFGMYQIFFPIYEDLEEISPEEFYLACTKSRCINCGKYGNSMVCQCAPKRKCSRCGRIHHIMLCGALIRDK